MNSPNLYQRASLVCSKIPYGKAATYGQIALLCGMPRNARQVGYGLKTGLIGPGALTTVSSTEGGFSAEPPISTPLTCRSFCFARKGWRSPGPKMGGKSI